MSKTGKTPNERRFTAPNFQISLSLQICVFSLPLRRSEGPPTKERSKELPTSKREIRSELSHSVGIMMEIFSFSHYCTGWVQCKHFSELLTYMWNRLTYPSNRAENRKLCTICA